MSAPEVGKRYYVKRPHQRAGITVEVSEVHSYNAETDFAIVFGNRIKWASDTGVYWGLRHVYSFRMSHAVETDTVRGHAIPGQAVTL